MYMTDAKRQGSAHAGSPWRLSVAGRPAKRVQARYRVVLEVQGEVLVGKKGYATSADAAAAMDRVREALGAPADGSRRVRFPLSPVRRCPNRGASRDVSVTRSPRSRSGHGAARCVVPSKRNRQLRAVGGKPAWEQRKREPHPHCFTH
jgi:hypothetical protein